LAHTVRIASAAAWGITGFAKEHPMKYPDLLRTALLAAATLATGNVLAQTTAPSTTTPGSSTPVVSDAAPLPPEDRSSTGALVIGNSPVRAQRENTSTRAMGAGPSPQSIGRNRAPARAQTEADLSRARIDRSLEFQRRGAASLEAN
jgi:hypothetical protein